MRSRLALSAALLLSLPLLMTAGTLTPGMVYDNGAPDTTNPCSPGCPELTTGTGQGLFTLVGNTVLTSARFWTFQSTNVYNGGTFQWQITLDNSGIPGALLAHGTFTLPVPQTALGQVSVAGLNLTEYQNDFAIPSAVINPSPSPQSYFLTIADLSGTPAPAAAFNGAPVLTGATDSFGIFWATGGQGIQAFQLFGTGNADPTVPEPATFALTAAALACGARISVQRRQSCRRMRRR
jgi:hypothetical protein